MRTDPAASYEDWENERHTRKEAENRHMAQSAAERQKTFKQSMRDAGFVRLEAYVTPEEREKFRALGSDVWLRQKINAAKVKK
jgi:hypothetical protein